MEQIINNMISSGYTTRHTSSTSTTNTFPSPPSTSNKRSRNSAHSQQEVYIRDTMVKIPSFFELSQGAGIYNTSYNDSDASSHIPIGRQVEKRCNELTRVSLPTNIFPTGGDLLNRDDSSCNESKSFHSPIDKSSIPSFNVLQKLINESLFKTQPYYNQTPDVSPKTGPAQINNNNNNVRTTGPEYHLPDLILQEGQEYSNREDLAFNLQDDQSPCQPRPQRQNMETLTTDEHFVGFPVSGSDFSSSFPVGAPPQSTAERIKKAKYDAVMKTLNRTLSFHYRVTEIMNRIKEEFSSGGNSRDDMEKSSSPEGTEINDILKTSLAEANKKEEEEEIAVTQADFLEVIQDLPAEVIDRIIRTLEEITELFSTLEYVRKWGRLPPKHWDKNSETQSSKRSSESSADRLIRRKNQSSSMSEAENDASNILERVDSQVIFDTTDDDATIDYTNESPPAEVSETNSVSNSTHRQIYNQFRQSMREIQEVDSYPPIILRPPVRGESNGSQGDAPPPASGTQTGLNNDSISDRSDVCSQCQNWETPEWRRGPDGPHTLCNACGLFYNKLLRKCGIDETHKIMEEKRENGTGHIRRLPDHYNR